MLRLRISVLSHFLRLLEAWSLWRLVMLAMVIRLHTDITTPTYIIGPSTYTWDLYEE